MKKHKEIGQIERYKDGRINGQKSRKSEISRKMDEGLYKNIYKK